MELLTKSLPQGPQKHFLNSTPPSHPPGQGPWTFSSSPTCPGLCSTPNKTVSSRQARFCDLSQHTSSWCGAGGDPHVCPGSSSCLPCDPSLDLNPPICAMGCQDQQASLVRVPRAAQGAGLAGRGNEHMCWVREPRTGCQAVLSVSLAPGPHPRAWKRLLASPVTQPVNA